MKKILIIIPVVFLFARFADAQNKAAGDERWDDQFITANAPDGIVRGIVSNGGNIYICGDFITAGGVSSAYVASWDGNSWSALGTGMNGTVYCLLYDSGLLYAGGNFSTAGGVAASNLAVWDGSNWQEFNGGTDGPVYAIAKQDMNIYVGGSFSTVDVTAASNIACWDGSAWNATGSGTNGTVYCIEPDGTTIYAGGDFTLAGGIAGTNYIAYWESSAWNAMSTGMDAVVRNILADAGSVYAAGDFTLSGGVTTNHIAKWNAGSWFALGTGTNGNIFSLQADGSDLYLGGSFTDANSVTASNICVYNGLDFNAMGSGTDNTVYALHISGYELFAGGNFLNAGGKQSEYIGRYMSPPVIITDPVNVIACIYDTVTFTVSAGGTEPLAYQWQLNGSDITGATGTSFTIYGVTPPDAGNYKCNVTNAAGTISSAQASLTVHLPPAVTVSPVNQEACLGDPVSMSVTASSTLPLTYQWQHEGTDITGAIFSTYNIASAAIPDTGQYLCIVENQCGDDTSDVAKLIVYPLPTVYFTGLDLNYCINDLPDTLHGVPSGGTFSGSGMTDSIFNPAGLLGLHTISYEYTDVHGCYNIYTKDFTGHTLPSVSMSGLDAEHCLNDNPDILTGTPAGGAFTGNGMTGNTLYPDIAGTGTHLITYTYTDTVGCTDTDTASTIIHEIPGIFIGNDTSICMGDSLTIYMSGDFGMYGWFFTTVINTSITVYPVSDTSYSGWIMNTYGCLGIDSIMVTVNPVPTGVSFSGLDTVYCNTGTPVPLTGTPAGGTYYGYGIAGETFYPSLSTPGYQEIIYQYTDSNNCSNSDTATVYIKPVISASFTGLDTLYCMNEPGDTLVATPSGGVFSGGNMTADFFDPVIAGPGIIEIIYTYPDTNGCFAYDTSYAHVADVPELVVSADTNICDGDTVILYANTDAGSTLLWSTLFVTDSIIVNPTSSTVYYVTASNSICSITDSIEVTWYPLPVVDLGADRDMCREETLNAGSGFAIYEWQPDLSGDSLLGVVSTGNYMVTATTDIGCFNSDTVYINVLPTPWVDLGNDITIYLEQVVIIGTGPGYDSYNWNTGESNPLISVIGDSLGMGQHAFWCEAAYFNGCTDSDTIIITVTYSIPVEEITQGTGISVYPNPSSGEFTIDFNVPGQRKMRFYIYDVTGKQVLAGEAGLVSGTGRLHISAGQLEPGSYILKATGDRQVYTKTLLVE